MTSKNLLNKKPIAGRFFVLTAFVSFAGHVFAQAPLELDLQTALTKTLGHHPNLRSYYYELLASESRTEQVSTSERPELTLAVKDALRSGDFSGIDSAQSTLSNSWVLDGAIRDARINVTRVQTSLIEIERDIEVADLSAESARLFVEALWLQEKEKVAQQSYALMQETVEALQNRRDAGRALLAEVLAAQAESSTEVKI